MIASRMESITLFAAFGTRSSFIGQLPPTSCCPLEASLNSNFRANVRTPGRLKTAGRAAVTEASALGRLARMLQSTRAMTVTRASRARRWPAGPGGWARKARGSGPEGLRRPGLCPGPVTPEACFARRGRCPRPPLALRGFSLLPREANKFQVFLASPSPQRFFIVGVWGPRPQRFQGRALAFLTPTPQSEARRLI
jgi:hypothetical protein